MIQPDNTNPKQTAIYVHIPFCEHKCIYCDFYSIITKDNISSFQQALRQEIKHYAELQSSNRIVTSIFFGGGTPSLMTPAYLREIIDLIKKKFNVLSDAEITLETNPGTVEQTKLYEFHQIGINRLSIGIQSFDENELIFLTRIHDKKTAIETVIKAKYCGFDNISIDLIFNLPGQTKEIWRRNLETAISLPTNHISAYSLILERGTILNKMVLDGEIKIQDEDYDADLYETTIDFLSGNGFNQYEVSNFAKHGFECLHNNSYWCYKDYFGFGPSAHSFIDGKRYWNFSSLKKYIYEISNLGIAVAGSEILSNEQRLNEYVMLALRSKGIDVIEMKNLFGEKWLIGRSDYLKELQQKKLLRQNDGLIYLTKAGYCVCDEILKNLL
jgi:oxygen-independent coproporphyrinogen-3 oxidase